MKSFKEEVFCLCKELESMDEFDKTKEVMRSLLKRSGDTLLDLKSDVCTNGINLRADFYGILLAFQSKLTIFNNVDKNSIKLTDDEYSAIMCGHTVLMTFIDKCLEDIRKQNPKLGDAISPYSFFNPLENVKCQNCVCQKMDNAVAAFKNTSVYKKVVSSDIAAVLLNVPENHIKTGIAICTKQITRAPLEVVPRKIRELKKQSEMQNQNKGENRVGKIEMDFVRVTALREMLSVAVNLLYNAILDSGLVVIDNNNLINIEKNGENSIGSYKTVLVQGGISNSFCDVLNRTIIFDFNNENTRIHEFARPQSVTYNFSQELGERTKISFRLLDEELNTISALTS